MIAKPFPDRAELFLLFIQHFGNILSGFCHSKGTVLRIIMYNIKKVEFDGLVYGQGGTVLEDDGNWWFTVSGCTGDVGDTLIARYYDWDDQLIGTIEFVKK